MIAFKKMWDDVGILLDGNQIKDIEIIEKFKSGFVVKDHESTSFVNREDFVNFWCKLLYYNEIETEKLLLEEESKLKYVYAVVKNLPYVDESSGMIKLI